MEEDLYGLLGDLGDLGVNGPRVGMDILKGDGSSLAFVSFPRLERKERKLVYEDIEKAIRCYAFEIQVKSSSWDEGMSQFFRKTLHNLSHSVTYIVTGQDDRALCLGIIHKISEIQKVELWVESKKIEWNRKDLEDF